MNNDIELELTIKRNDIEEKIIEDYTDDEFFSLICEYIANAKQPERLASSFAERLQERAEL